MGRIECGEIGRANVFRSSDRVGVQAVWCAESFASWVGEVVEFECGDMGRTMYFARVIGSVFNQCGSAVSNGVVE